MWTANNIFYVMFDIKEIRFFWCIHISTKANGEILKIIFSLNSDVNDFTNPVIE